MSSLTLFERTRAIMHAAIPHQHKLILLALHDHYDHEAPQRPMRVSVERLAAMLQIGESTAYRWLAGIKKTDLIRHESPGVGRCTRYWICWARLQALSNPDLKRTPRKMTGVTPSQDEGGRPSQDERGVDLDPSQIENRPLPNRESTPPRMGDEEALEVALEEATSSSTKGSTPIAEALPPEPAPEPEPIPMPPAEGLAEREEEAAQVSQDTPSKPAAADPLMLPINEAFEAAGMRDRFSVTTARVLWAIGIRRLDQLLALSGGRGSLIGLLRKLAAETFDPATTPHRAEAIKAVQQRHGHLHVADKVDLLLGAHQLAYRCDQAPEERPPRRLWDRPEYINRKPLKRFDHRDIAEFWLSHVAGELAEVRAVIAATPDAGRDELRQWLGWRVEDPDMILAILDERGAAQERAA